MKVITCNLNGIRSAASKGFFTWITKENPDFICVQETKAQMYTLSNEELYPNSYHANFANAVKKGYSGGNDKSDNAVNAISGATITGDGVTAMIQERLKNYKSFFEQKKNSNVAIR